MLAGFHLEAVHYYSFKFGQLNLLNSVSLSYNNHSSKCIFLIQRGVFAWADGLLLNI